VRWSGAVCCTSGCAWFSAIACCCASSAVAFAARAAFALSPSGVVGSRTKASGSASATSWLCWLGSSPADFRKSATSSESVSNLLKASCCALSSSIFLSTAFASLTFTPNAFAATGFFAAPCTAAICLEMSRCLFVASVAMASASFNPLSSKPNISPVVSRTPPIDATALIMFAALSADSPFNAYFNPTACNALSLGAACDIDTAWVIPICPLIAAPAVSSLPLVAIVKASRPMAVCSSPSSLAALSEIESSLKYLM